MRFNSQFGLDDQVKLFAGYGISLTGKVKGVRFIDKKVLYDIELDEPIAGCMMRDVDSTFVGREVEADGVSVEPEGVTA